MEIKFEPNQDYCKNCMFGEHIYSSINTEKDEAVLVCRHELACSRMYIQTVKEMRDMTFDILGAK